MYHTPFDICLLIKQFVCQHNNLEKSKVFSCIEPFLINFAQTVEPFSVQPKRMGCIFISLSFPMHSILNLILLAGAASGGAFMSQPSFRERLDIDYPIPYLFFFLTS
jgi:hypothetical protein